MPRPYISVGKPASAHWIDGREKARAFLDGFGCAQTKIFAEAAGDKLYAQGSVVRDSGRYGNARQPHYSGGKDGCHGVEYSRHRGGILLIQSQWERRFSAHRHENQRIAFKEQLPLPHEAGPATERLPEILKVARRSSLDHQRANLPNGGPAVLIDLRKHSELGLIEHKPGPESCRLFDRKCGCLLDYIAGVLQPCRCLLQRSGDAGMKCWAWSGLDQRDVNGS